MQPLSVGRGCAALREAVLWGSWDRHSCTLGLGLAQVGQILQLSKMVMLYTGNVPTGAHKGHMCMHTHPQTYRHKHRDTSVHTSL